MVAEYYLEGGGAHEGHSVTGGGCGVQLVRPLGRELPGAENIEIIKIINQEEPSIMSGEYYSIT